MKIALVSPYTLPVSRGNSLTVQRLFDGLRGRGLCVRLFNSTADAPAELTGFAPDLIHSLHALQPHAWLLQSGMLGVCPWIVTMTGTDYNSDVQPQALRALSSARALVVFHAEAAESVRARFPDCADRVHIIPQGVHVPDNKSGAREDARRAWNIAHEDLVFFMAAGLRPVKNIGYALEAFALFRKKHPWARLLLAGPCLDADESDRVRAAGERIEGFSYCGELPHARVLALMQASDVFLNTSLQEGMPGAVMEAMAAGVAVVATDVTGNRALIKNMRTGILVPLHDTGLLLNACEHLAASPDLRQQLGGAARQDMRMRFDCEAELQALEALYICVLSS